MNLQDYIENMKNIQENILLFLDNEEDREENYENLVSLLENQKIRKDKNELETFLHLINTLSNYHHRNSSFFKKIEQILLLFKEEIIHNYSNFSIFWLFQNNKRILLFLIKEKMITIDKKIYETMCNEHFSSMNYLFYFQPEVQPFLSNKSEPKSDNKSINEFLSFLKSINHESSNKIPTGEVPEDFEEKRRIGENDEYICELIRNDSIDQFITYVNQNSISLNMVLDVSIYETNYMLLPGESSLIEYAAFFGSVQIFKYLYLNKVELEPSIWLYAVHGNNPELIYLLEENNVILKKHSFFSQDFDNINEIEEGEEEDENEEEKHNETQENKKENNRIKENKDYEEEDIEEEEEEINEDDENFEDLFAESSEGVFDDYDPLTMFSLTYKKCLKEAIKCHHNEIANYIQENYMKKRVIKYNNENSFGRSINAYSFKYYNYVFFPTNFSQNFIFLYACKSGYYHIVKELLKEKNAKLKLKITNISKICLFNFKQII